MINEFRKMHLETRQQKSEKISPAMRMLTGCITGGDGATTEEAITRNYAKLNETEKELYRQKVLERHAALKKITEGDSKQYGMGEYVGALQNVSFVARIIGVDLESTQ